MITDRYENIRVRGGEWFRRLQVVADYSVPGQPLEHRAICDVDEKTYDSLQVGNTVTVYYFAALLQQPFLTASQLDRCSTAASLGLNSPLLPRVVITCAALLAILFFWRVLRIRICAWLLFAWIAFAFAYIGLPRLERAPQHPVATAATVDSVVTITTLGDMPLDKTLPLQHPYQIVLLQFVPPGTDTPVKAVDKIDAGSAPNLKPEQPVAIFYDAGNPRVAQLQQAPRHFPGQTLRTVMLFCLVYIVLVAIAGAVIQLVSFGRRKALS